jgi:hypothetical protein
VLFVYGPKVLGGVGIKSVEEKVLEVLRQPAQLTY